MESVEEAPGTVVQADSGGLQIAAPGGRIAIGKVRPETGGKMDAAAFVEERGLKKGDQFSEQA
jgi:methionyl-tRNA formyltransferase